MSQAKLDVIPLFYIPLVHIVLDEDTDELKTCNEYLTSAVQSDNPNIGNEYVKNYRRLEQFPKTKDILTRVCNSIIKNILKFDIQFPGLGNIFMIFGKIKKNTYGIANPKEMTRNIVMIV